MKPIELSYVDNLSGRQFEFFTGKLLKFLGYHHVIITKATGDFGLDVLATNNNGITLGLQCKHYAPHNKIGYKAVEEANSGQDYYKNDYSIVLTNRSFSKHAVIGAKYTHVVLWNRHKLISLIQKANAKIVIDRLKNTYTNVRLNEYTIIQLKIFKSIIGAKNYSDLVENMIKIYSPVILNTPNRINKCHQLLNYDIKGLLFKNEI